MMAFLRDNLGFDSITDQRWFIAPKHRGDGGIAPDVEIHNAAGELVATFESWSDAELTVSLHNNAVETQS